MTDPTTTFFEGLSRRGREPMVGGVTATVRFDVTHGTGTRSWLLTIDHGDFTVAPGPGSADCVISADETLFSALIRGEANAMAALLRGELAVTGDPELLVTVQRIFPAPPRAAHRTDRTEAGQPA